MVEKARGATEHQNITNLKRTSLWVEREKVSPTTMFDRQQTAERWIFLSRKNRVFSDKKS
jgi:hypothetical protein